MGRIKTFFLILALLPMLAFAKQKVILVNSQMQDCIGLDNKKKQCLEYREKGSNKPWQFLYQPIKGFKFVPGYTYTLLINETVPLKQADTTTSTTLWSLIKVIKKGRMEVMEYAKMPEEAASLEGEWQFSKMMVPGQTVVFAAGKEMLRFTDSTKRVNGKASCNSFFGTYTIAGYELKFGALGSTMMACPRLDKERMMMKSLENVNMWEVKGNTLLLKNASTVIFELEKIIKKTT